MKRRRFPRGVVTLIVAGMAAAGRADTMIAANALYLATEW
jgi:hypothetical protein